MTSAVAKMTKVRYVLLPASTATSSIASPSGLTTMTSVSFVAQPGLPGRPSGVFTLRHNHRLHHIGVGLIHARAHVIMLAHPAFPPSGQCVRCSGDWWPMRADVRVGIGLQPAIEDFRERRRLPAPRG